MENIESLKFPIGKYQPPKNISKDVIAKWSEDIRSLPDDLQDLLIGTGPEQYQHCYRKGSWNIHQLLYHLTDSHSHSYIRFKWTLTEDTPIIKAYDEQAWAITPEVMNTPPDDILEDLRIINRRISRIINNLDESEFNLSFTHPETNATISLAVLSGMYAWHGRHHMEHIKIALKNPVINYLPIGCGFYDELVLRAMRQTPLQVFKSGHFTGEEWTINDLSTSNKEEFIHFSNGKVLRLDQIIKVEQNRLYL